MTAPFLVGTEGGLVLAEFERGEFLEQRRVLEGRDVTGVVSREGVVLAGTTQGVFRSDDRCETWTAAGEGLEIAHVRCLAYHPDVSDLEFAGTEPAGIFVSNDGARTWHRCPEVEALRDRHGWFLPYSPEAGCVRGFAFHGDRAYAAVEVGGVLRSDDRGRHWRLTGGSTGEPGFDIPPSPLVFPDVHSVLAHPDSPDLVWAVTAEGLYASDDAGDAWVVFHEGSYCRAAWIDPANAGRIILGPADSVSDKNGRIEQSNDGGRTWLPASDGLDLPWPDRMVERFFDVDDRLFAITNDGRLYASELQAMQWRLLMTGTRRARAIAKFGEA